MPRMLKVVAPASSTAALLSRLQGMDGIFHLQLEPGVSRIPPGDLVTIGVTGDTLPALMRELDRLDLGRPGGLSLATSEPDCVVTSGLSRPLDRESNQGTWEEMLNIIAKDSNTHFNTMLLMALAGGIAVTGIAGNSLHIVIAAMLLAPGFMPIMRVPLGLVAGSRLWFTGMFDFAKGYLALAAGAALTSLLLRALGMQTFGDAAAYYGVERPLWRYWTELTASSIIASTAAALSGAILISTKRSVFTSGVMIGLALVPSAAIAAVAALQGDFGTAGPAALRWLADVGLITAVSFAYFGMERARRLRRAIRD